WVLGADKRNCGAQHVHRVARQRHGHHQVDEEAVEVAQGLFTRREADEGVLLGYTAIPQQVGYFLKAAVARQLLDRVATVGQRVGLWDNLRHGGFINDDAVEALADFWGFRHGVLLKKWACSFLGSR